MYVQILRKLKLLRRTKLKRYIIFHFRLLYKAKACSLLQRCCLSVCLSICLSAINSYLKNCTSYDREILQGYRIRRYKIIAVIIILLGGRVRKLRAPQGGVVWLWND